MTARIGISTVRTDLITGTNVLTRTYILTRLEFVIIVVKPEVARANPLIIKTKLPMRTTESLTTRKHHLITGAVRASFHEYLNYECRIGTTDVCILF